MNICLNYGGRDEILRAAQAWGRDLLAGRQTVEDLTDEAFSRYLDSRGMPDPDLIIRPSGELRLSNFLTWQSAYAEFYFTDVLWPDFTPQVLDEALAAFQRRQRGLEAYNREKSYFGGLCGCACDPSGSCSSCRRPLPLPSSPCCR